MKRHTGILFVAGLSLLALAGCGEEEPAEQAEPQSGAEESAPQADEGDANEALDQIREGAESLGEGARKLFEEGSEAAYQAFEDAGPALEKVEEMAGEVGKSVNEIVERARDDLEALQKRIEEADGESGPVTGDPDAVLAPADRLNEDTKAAARAGPAGVGPDYVGVWAAEAAECSRIDQEATEIFAVITPTTIRRYESVCNFEAAEMTGGSADVTAECIAEGATEDRRITFSMDSPDTLTIGTGEASGVDLVRCHLPR